MGGQKEKRKYKQVHLADSMDKQYYDADIQFNAICIGKDLSPYLVPEEVEAVCAYGDIEKNKCAGCPLLPVPDSDKLPKQVYKYDPSADRSSIISFINASDSQIQGIIRRDLGLPSSRVCNNSEIIINKRMNVEDINLIPEIDDNATDKDYVIRRAFVIDKKVIANSNYMFQGTTWADPKNQKAIHLVHEAKNINDTLSKFKIDANTKKLLKIFKVENDNNEKQIKEKLKEYYYDLAHTVTGIYNRSNIHMACDLVYHSPITYKFAGKKVSKGWAECLIIGDTRTGKTETVKKIFQHYRADAF